MTATPSPSGGTTRSTSTFLYNAARGTLFFLSLVLLYTAFAKLTDPAGFAKILQSQGLLTRGTNIAAWAVPLTELSIAATALYSLAAALPSARFLAWAQAALFVTFTVYCASLWANPPRVHVPCGCGFSKSLVADWSGPTLRAGVLAVLALSSASLLHANSRRFR